MNSLKKYLLLSMLLAAIFSGLLSADEIDAPQYTLEDLELNDEEFYNHDTDELVRQNEILLFKRLKSTEIVCYDCEQNLENSQEVFSVISDKAPEGIIFKEERISPFDNAGVCSAMAFDFLTRYKNNCEADGELNKNGLCVKKFEPFYKIQTSFFMSKQQAYNTISVNNVNGLSSEEIKYRKMQSLANYHNIKLVPTTKTLKLTDIKSGKAKFKKTIDDLATGTYIIRLLLPDPTLDKLELKGHTITLIKHKKFAILYDNAKGPVLITSSIGSTVEKAMIITKYPELRLYKATCGSEGCKGNLSTEKHTDFHYEIL